MDEIKLDLLSLENEVNNLDEELTKNIRKELMFLRKDIENLEDDLCDLKEAWDLIGGDYKDLEDIMEMF